MLLSWMGRMLARLVSVVFVLYGLLLIVANGLEVVQGTEYPGPWWVLPWIFASGLASLAGGILFFLTFDGPERFATRRWRALALAVMFLATILPTSLTGVVVVLVVIMLPSLFLGLGDGAAPEEAATGD